MKNKLPTEDYKTNQCHCLPGICLCHIKDEPVILTGMCNWDGAPVQRTNGGFNACNLQLVIWKLVWYHFPLLHVRLAKGEKNMDAFMFILC